MPATRRDSYWSSLRFTRSTPNRLVKQTAGVIRSRASMLPRMLVVRARKLLKCPARPDWDTPGRASGVELAVDVTTGTSGLSPTALVMMPMSLPSFSTRSFRSLETPSAVRSDSVPVGLKSRLTRPPTRRYPEADTMPFWSNQLPATR